MMIRKLIRRMADMLRHAAIAEQMSDKDALSYAFSAVTEKMAEEIV